MLVHKGGKIKNWGGECRDVTPTKLQSQNIFKESTWGSGWGSQDGYERRIKVFVKIQKKIYIFFLGGTGRGGGWGSGWGVRVDVNREVKFLCKLKKMWGGGRFGGGGGGFGLGGQGGCE